jgi:hypothetical protein
METDSTRDWTSPIILSQPSHPPLHHDSQNHIPPNNHKMSSEPRSQYTTEPLYGPAGGPMSHSIPLQGPVSHPDGPRDYPQSQHLNQFPANTPDPSGTPIAVNDRRSPKQEPYYSLNGTEMFNHNQETPSPSSTSQDMLSSQGGAGANHYPSSTGGRRLPPIMQVEKQQVTTSATQLASASRRRNEAHFVCPVPGCGSTFTRRFNLRGRLYF